MKPPDRIYLQWHGDVAPEFIAPEEVVSVADVTWEAERVFKADIEYVRAAPPTEAEVVSVPRELLERIADILDGEWTASSYAECNYCGKQLGKDHQCELIDIEREIGAILSGVG